MNKCKKAASIVVGAVAIFISANSMAMVNAKAMDPSLEKNLVKVCEALKSNNQRKVMRAIKHSRINERAIANKLQCNGMTPIEFVRANNAENSAKFLARYMSDKPGQRLAKKN